MRTIIKGGLLAALMLPLCLVVKAQDTTARKKDTTLSTTKKYHPVAVNLQVRNLYIWRGFKVSNSPISDVDLHYVTRDGSLALGVWGGEGFTGDYKEFDYYASYTKNGFNVSLWDINNFTDYPNANLFNYNPSSTSHFIDATVGYQFKDSFPLSISWSTIVQGRDTYTRPDGTAGNRYSNYVSLDYKIWKEKDADLHIYVAGAFAFGYRQNFYGSEPNIVNTGLTYDKNLNIFGYKLPISATAMVSPEHKYGTIQLIANIF